MRYFIGLIFVCPLDSFRNGLLISLIRRITKLKYHLLLVCSRVLSYLSLSEHRQRQFFISSFDDNCIGTGLDSPSKPFKNNYFLISLCPTPSQEIRYIHRFKNQVISFERISLFPLYLRADWIFSLPGVRHPRRFELEILRLAEITNQKAIIVFPIELIFFSGFLREVFRIGRLKRFSKGIVCLNVDMDLFNKLHVCKFKSPGSLIKPLGGGSRVNNRKRPTIGVVIPNLNGATYLEECISSVLKNKARGDRIVVIDGGSVDGSLEIIERYRRHVDYCIIEPDNGQSAALNKGLRLLQTEFITWLCSDDYFEDGSFDRVKDTTKKFEAEIIFGGCHVYDQLNNKSTLHYSALPFRTPTRLNFRHLLQFSTFWHQGYYFYQPEVFFKRQLFERIGGFLDETLYYAMDYDMFLRMSRFNPVAVQIPSILATSRRHPHQKTQLSGIDYLPSIERIVGKFV